MKMVKRYHPGLVTLHWLIALLIFTVAFLGIYLDDFASTAQKPGLLGIHMAVGLLTLVLMVVRIFVRVNTPKPAPVTAGNAVFDWIGKATHLGLYVFVILTTGTGMLTSMQGNLMPVVYGGVGTLPADFFTITAFIGHVISLPVLVLTIFLHIGAALYHQFLLKDNLLARMGYGSQQ
ncbi:MAG: cytochrome b/b6 domain-containing protein [Chloroflexota bacterium]